MKPTIISALLVLLVLTGTNLQAQALEESTVKILPGKNSNMIKVLYASEVTDPIKVKFITSQGVIDIDKINGPYPTGLLKTYDVRNINHDDFWVEVTSPELTVVYHIVPSNRKQNFVSYLEKVDYNQALVKAKN